MHKTQVEFQHQTNPLREAEDGGLALIPALEKQRAGGQSVSEQAAWTTSSAGQPELRSERLSQRTTN